MSRPPKSRKSSSVRKHTFSGLARPRKPRGPKTPYNYFYEEERKKIDEAGRKKAEIEGVTFAKKSAHKEIGDRWRIVQQQKRGVLEAYKELAEEDKRRYALEMEEYTSKMEKFAALEDEAEAKYKKEQAIAEMRCREEGEAGLRKIREHALVTTNSADMTAMHGATIGGGGGGGSTGSMGSAVGHGTDGGGSGHGYGMYSGGGSSGSGSRPMYPTYHQGHQGGATSAGAMSGKSMHAQQQQQQQHPYSMMSQTKTGAGAYGTAAANPTYYHSSTNTNTISGQMEGYGSQHMSRGTMPPYNQYYPYAAQQYYIQQQHQHQHQQQQQHVQGNMYEQQPQEHNNNNASPTVGDYGNNSDEAQDLGIIDHLHEQQGNMPFEQTADAFDKTLKEAGTKAVGDSAAYGYDYAIHSGQMGMEGGSFSGANSAHEQHAAAQTATTRQPQPQKAPPATRSPKSPVK